MARWDFLPELPGTYEVAEGQRGVLVCLAGWREALASVGLGPDDTRTAAAPVADAAPRGRRPVELLTVRETPLVVRHHARGGLFRWLNHDRFADPARAFEELLLASQLAERGIPTPEVVAARAQRSGALGWKLCLATRRIEDALDGAGVLRLLADGSLAASMRHLVVRTVGEFLGSLHAAGLQHADLTPNNILLGSELRAGKRPRCWILDLDRSRLFAELTDEQRARNLERFFRAIQKRQLYIASGLGASDAARFLRSYVTSLGRLASEWRDEWSNLARIERRGRLAHRASWLLETLFAGGGPGRRAST